MVDFFYSRNFEQAEYLLDPVGNDALLTWPQREQAATYQAIFGAQRFAQHTSKGNGTTWRCSSAAQLREAVKLIDDLDVAAVRREFSIAGMLELGVYKVHPEDDADESFQRTLVDLRVWADHCRAVAADDLDLIITQV